ncbi:carbohydrate ABC transporter permease [Actinopolymorpha alba]|uniref:carbohydrate ABC transporter permease n=1 Tax=Actinopolymorpha alba TaxID=533267 RepID=UPI0003808040|nr:carbohydrate ABC transporter permease [Actinopolymorpha alba]
MMAASDVAAENQSWRPARRGSGGLTVVLVPAAWSLAIFDLFVVAWLFVNSLKTTPEIFQNPWGLPDKPQWRNYLDAWNTAHFGEGVLNSLILVVASGAGTLLLAAPAAYALTRFRWRWSGAVTVFFAMGLGVPAQSLFIPLYVGMDRLGLVNTLWGLLLVYTATNLPFAVFFLTAFFASLPYELEEAAALDGAGPGYTFWRIMLPLTRSGPLTLFVLQAIGDWGETFFALVFLQDKKTISLALLNFTQTMQYTGAEWSVLFAGICIIVIPLILLYLWMGSRLIEGIAAGYGK